MNELLKVPTYDIWLASIELKNCESGEAEVFFFGPVIFSSDVRSVHRLDETDVALELRDAGG
jgi:hypothetical protein